MIIAGIYMNKCEYFLRCFPQYSPFYLLLDFAAASNLTFLIYLIKSFLSIIFFNKNSVPKGDLWVQSPMIIVGQSPNIRSIAEHSVNRRTFGQSPKIAGDRRRSTEAYRRVMSTWPSMMVGTAEGDLPKLFSPALLA